MIKRYAFVISFGFSTADLQSCYPRETFEAALNEGTELLRQFAKQGMRVSLSIRDLSRPVFVFTLDPEHVRETGEIQTL